MDFSFTEEQEILKDSLRKFLAKEISPIAWEREDKGSLGREEIVSYIKKLIPFGFYIGGLPEEYGGLSLDYKTYGMIYEELARSWPSLAGTINMTDIGLTQSMFLNIDHLREKYSHRIESGTLITAADFTKPNADSNANCVETTAVADGDHYIVNGSKSWILNGTACDVCSVSVKTDESQGQSSNRIIVIDKEESPFEIREIKKLGLRALPTCELLFNDCRVQKENMLPAEFYPKMTKWIDTVHSMWGFHANGIGQAALDASIEYSKKRIQFAKPIGNFQMVQDMIYQMYANIETSRLICYRVADMLDKGETCRKEASLARVYATKAAIKATSMAIEIHGAYGLSDEYPLERLYRDARACTISNSNIEVQKLKIAEELLRL